MFPIVVWEENHWCSALFILFISWREKKIKMKPILNLGNLELQHYLGWNFGICSPPLPLTNSPLVKSPIVLHKDVQLMLKGPLHYCHVSNHPSKYYYYCWPLLSFGFCCFGCWKSFACWHTDKRHVAKF